MKMKLLLLSIALPVLGLMLYWLFHSRADGTAAAAARSAPAGALQASAQPRQGGAPLLVTAPRQGAAPAAAARPAGLTDRNTIFRTDARNQLLVDGEVAMRLQALVDTLPQQYELDQLRQVEETVREGLPGPLALQALQLLHQYLAYATVQQEVLRQPRPDDQLLAAQRTLDVLIELRRRFFGEATARQLFAQEEAGQQALLDGLRQDAAR